MTDFPLRVRNGRDLKYFRGFTEELLEFGTQLPPVHLAEYKEMPAEDKSAFNEARRRVITRGVIVRNGSYQNVSTVLFGVMRESGTVPFRPSVKT